MSQKNKHIVTGLICAGVGFGIAYIMKRYSGNMLKNLWNVSFLKPHVVTVNSLEDCQIVTENIKNRCSQYRILGFDCEWVTQNGKRRPVALLQIASTDGYCALIRLSLLKGIPLELKKLLEDDTIYKVGVAPLDDARYLFQDYGISLAGCLDLRHLSKGLHKGGLSGMALHYLGVEMDKHWRIRCSDWEADELSDRQVQYASQDALIAVQIFSQLTTPWWQFWGLPKWSRVEKACKNFIDIKYKSKSGRGGSSNISSTQRTNISKNTKRAFSTRQKPLYDNCYLQAPDGEILSTCERSKAEWYVAKNLGEIIETDPLTVRLNFEPAGRAEGEVGKYYTTAKANQCVVCGNAHSFIRKHVVPHEYRKYFPPVMKDHSSHDILLLCLECHLRNSELDSILRQQLAEKCNAPIGSCESVRVIEVPELKKLRSAARALGSANADKLPPARRKELEQLVRSHFGLDEKEELTPELLNDANNVVVGVINSEYIPHGQRIVSHFIENGGLVQLERLWREHFLACMQPKFLPPLWSVNHSRIRLEQHKEQGRILPEEVTMAGFT